MNNKTKYLIFADRTVATFAFDFVNRSNDGALESDTLELISDKLVLMETANSIPSRAEYYLVNTSDTTAFTALFERALIEMDSAPAVVLAVINADPAPTTSFPQNGAAVSLDASDAQVTPVEEPSDIDDMRKWLDTVSFFGEFATKRRKIPDVSEYCYQSIKLDTFKSIAAKMTDWCEAQFASRGIYWDYADPQIEVSDGQYRYQFIFYNTILAAQFAKKFESECHECKAYLEKSKDGEK